MGIGGSFIRIILFLFFLLHKSNRKVLSQMNGLVNSVKIFGKRNASTILTVVGGVGVLITSIMAVKATPKAMTILEQAKDEKGEELTKFEKFKMAGPSYIPATIVGIGTVTCIFGANVLNKRQQAALVSAYTLVDSSYKQYRHKLVELYGKDTHNEIVDAIAVEKAEEVGIYAESLCANTCLTDEESCGEPVLFYDEFGGRYFESTIEQVIAAEYHTNRNFTLRGYAVLNELYEFLGLEPTDYGNTVGWAVDSDLYWIDFNHRKTVLEDGLECYILESYWSPSADFLEYY